MNGKIKYFDLILIPHNQTFLFETCNKLVSLLDRFLVLKSNLSNLGEGWEGRKLRCLVGGWDVLLSDCYQVQLANSRGQASYHIGYPRVIGVVS